MILYLTARRKGRKNILVAYVTVHGVKRNQYFNELSPDVVLLQDLFAGS